MPHSPIRLRRHYDGCRRTGRSELDALRVRISADAQSGVDSPEVNWYKVVILDDCARPAPPRRVFRCRLRYGAHRQDLVRRLGAAIPAREHTAKAQRHRDRRDRPIADARAEDLGATERGVVRRRRPAAAAPLRHGCSRRARRRLRPARSGGHRRDPGGEACRIFEAAGLAAAERAAAAAARAGPDRWIDRR
jgi:hypothetical protein